MTASSSSIQRVSSKQWYQRRVREEILVGRRMPRILVTLRENPSTFLDFYLYCKKHLCLESLHFLLEAHEYKTSHPCFRKEKEEKIVKKYFVATSKQRVNVVHTVTTQILGTYGAGKVQVFDEAVNHLNTLLENETLPNFRNSYKPNPKSELSSLIVAKKKLIVSTATTVVDPDILPSVVWLLTGERPKKEKSGPEQLLEEEKLKKWLVEDFDEVPNVFLVSLEEDLDPVATWEVLRFYRTSYPDILGNFITFYVRRGLEESNCEGSPYLSELGISCSVLRQFLLLASKSWWAKVLKKSLEGIYRTEIENIKSKLGNEVLCGCTESKVVELISSIFNGILEDPKTIPVEIKYVIQVIYEQYKKQLPHLDEKIHFLGSTKILFDTVCSMLSCPENVPFKLIRDTTTSHSLSLLVTDGLRCLYEQDLHCLSRDAKIVSVLLEIRERFTDLVVSLGKNISQTPVELTKTTSKMEADMSIILFFLRSNLDVLLECCPNSKVINRLFSSSTHVSQEDSLRSKSCSNTSNEDISKRRQRQKRMMKSRDTRFPTAEEKVSSEDHIFQESTLADLFKYLVRDKLQITMDYSPYILLLQKEGIHTVQHLSLVPYSELQNLPIPIVLRYQLNEYCKQPTPPFLQSRASFLPNFAPGYSHEGGSGGGGVHFHGSLDTSLPNQADHSGTGYSEVIESQPIEINYENFSKTSYAVIGFTQFGIIEYVNLVMSKLSGYAPHELIGKSLCFLLTPKYFSIDPVAHLRASTKESTKIELVGKDASTKLCSFNVSENTRKGSIVFLAKIEAIKNSSCRYDASNPLSLCETLTDLVIAIGPDGKIHYANPKSKSVTGWKPRELMGKNVNILMQPDIANKHDMYLATYLRTGTKHLLGCVKGADVKLLRKDKKLCKIHIVVTEHEIGGKLHYVGVIYPKEDWSRYDKMNDSIIIINTKGIIEYANAACKALTGYKPSSLLGRNVKTLMTTEYSLHHDQYLKDYHTTGIKHVIGVGRFVPVLHRSGTTIQMHLTVNEVLSVNEKFFVGVLKNKNSFEASQDNTLIKNLSNALVELINPAILVTKRGLVKIFNPAAERELGWKSDQVLGNNVKMLLPERYARDHDEYLHNYLQTGVGTTVNRSSLVPFLTSSGVEKLFMMSLSEKKDADLPVYWIAVLTLHEDSEIMQPPSSKVCPFPRNPGNSDDSRDPGNSADSHDTGNSDDHRDPRNSDDHRDPRNSDDHREPGNSDDHYVLRNSKPDLLPSPLSVDSGQDKKDSKTKLTLPPTLPLEENPRESADGEGRLAFSRARRDSFSGIGRG
eukprot:TRINITY_DN3393_c0_g1_i3.p1 TRINITY_DN3393_c0_g1~~TRINITY_DN3393_c0_g1_i3.p1  ORF type:complete len:1299 (-),score=308.84 TRINITY_DN3393_c0_g1_i3:59-3955(-)